MSSSQHPESGPPISEPVTSSRSIDPIVDGLPAISPSQYEVTTLDQVRVSIQEWIHEPFTPEGVFGLLVGREGMGKGLFTAWENALLTNGTADLGRPVNVGIFSTEESLTSQVTPRHRAARADCSRVFTLTVKPSDGGDCKTRTLAIDLPRDVELLRGFITDNRLRLLTIDPLISSLSDTIRMKDEKPVRSVLEQLQSLAEETRCTIRGIIHFNKATGLDILDRIMNSKAFSAVSRHTLAMGFDPDDPEAQRIMLVVAKSNIAWIGDALVFTKDKHVVGQRSNGRDATVAHLTLAGQRTGVDPHVILERPRREEEDEDVPAVRQMLESAPQRVMSVTQFNDELTSYGINPKTQDRRVKKILDAIGWRKQQKIGSWWVVPTDSEPDWNQITLD